MMPAILTDEERFSLGLSFAQLRQVNLQRCETPRPEGFGHLLDEWSILEWAGAMAGEAGEAANAAKKLRRGDPGEAGLVRKLMDELADTVIYADLAAARVRKSLAGAVIRKFNQTSEEKGSSFVLLPPWRQI